MQRICCILDEYVHEYAAAGWLTFTEPNLSFAVDTYEGSRLQPLIGLSHESAAPPLNQMRPKRSQLTVMSDSRQLVPERFGEFVETSVATATAPSATHRSHLTG